MKKVLIQLVFIPLFFCSSDSVTEPLRNYSLTVKAETGGSVNTSGGNFEAGELVTLSATASAGYVFTGWSNGSTKNPLLVSVFSNQTITAVFEEMTYSLLINTVGEGTVSETLVSSGRNADYTSGSVVKLTAEPSTEWNFVRWSGDYVGTDNPIEISITEEKNITAIFENENIEVNDEIQEIIPLSTKRIYISQSIEGNIEERDFIIQTPDFIDINKSYPIVFAFHGRNTLNTSWVNKLKSFTDNGSFIGIYPQGFLKTWNIGEAGTEASKANDIEFVELIIEELNKYSNLNFDKMYAIGTSNGSLLTNKIGIELSYFKAIAPIVSQLTEGLPLKSSTQPLSIYQVNGAADTTIPIEGGPKLGHVFFDSLDSVYLWSNHFDCDSSPEIEILDEDTLYIFKNCSDNKEVRYLRVENGQHNLHWGNPDLFDKIWEFFQRF